VSIVSQFEICVSISIGIHQLVNPRGKLTFDGRLVSASRLFGVELSGYDVHDNSLRVKNMVCACFTNSVVLFLFYHVHFLCCETVCCCSFYPISLFNRRLNAQTTADIISSNDLDGWFILAMAISRNIELVVTCFIPPFALVANGLSLIIFWRMQKGKQQVWSILVYYKSVHYIHVLH
jgi:hypothetical protein